MRRASETYVAHLYRTMPHTDNLEGSDARRKTFQGVCVFFTFSRSFDPSTSSTPSVRAEVAPREAKALSSEDHDRNIFF